MASDSSLQTTCESLWQRVRDTAYTCDAATLDRAAGCLAVGLADMVVSARTVKHRMAAEALAGAPGVCTVSGLSGRADLSGAVVANAYLMHARLTDDSYQVAAHPGLAVVPVALAAAERVMARHGQTIAADRLLRAIVGGYECGCRLADQLLPEVSRRGWRVTSVIAPLAAAATMALALDLPDTDACAALGLASSATGGPLGVVATDGDDWRLQPALAVQAGMSAAVAAAAGLRSGAGALGGPQGLYALFGGTSEAAETWPDREPAVHHVTFKRHPVAMYGQSIFEAVRAAPQLTGQLERIVVSVAPFAAAYAGRNASTDSIASVPGIALAAARAFHPGLVSDAGRPPVDVLDDPDLPDLAAHVALELADGRRIELAGDGDTSGWKPQDFRRHCADLLGDTGVQLYEAAAALPRTASPRGLLQSWRAAR